MNIQTGKQAAGRMGFYCSNVILNNDQILTLPTKSPLLTIAPGKGKFIVPIIAILKSDFRGGVYTNLGADETLCYFVISCGTDGYNLDLTTVGDGVRFFGNALGNPLYRQQIVPLHAISLPVTKLDQGPPVAATWWYNYAPSNYTGKQEDQPANFSVWNNISGDFITSVDFTGGHPNNTLKIRMYYDIFDL